MRSIDSHLHLCEYDDVGPVLRFAESSETLLISAGIDRESSLRTLRLAASRPGVVRPFVGIHPSEAEKGTRLSWMPRAVAAASGVGEIGLDPKYSPVARGGAQARAFGAQLAQAEKAGVPVVVHSRNAERECLDAMSSYRLSAVLLHWFQGETLCSEANGRGYFISFGPALIFSKKIQRIAASCSPDLALTESDGPVPFPSIGISGPYSIASVVFKLSELRRSSFEEAALETVRNGAQFLRRSRKG